MGKTLSERRAWQLILGGIISLSTSCGEVRQQEAQTTTTPSSAATTTEPDAAVTVPVADTQLADTTFAELTAGSVQVRGDGRQHAYIMGENSLFAGSTTEFLPDASKKLWQVASSINMRYPRQYVHVMAVGSPDSKLTAQRMVAVRNWLVQNARIDAAVEKLPLPAAAAGDAAASVGILVSPTEL